jgi:RES domain-containing protein
VALSDLACPWEGLVSRGVEPPSWRLAKRLIGEGYAAVVVPSSARGATKADRNIVFWKWSELLPHRVLVVDDEARLPRDGRSWEALTDAVRFGAVTTHPA